MSELVKSKKQMNLLVTIDHKYLNPLITMLQSYAAVHKDIQTDVYLAHSSLKEEDFDRIREAVISEDIHIHNIHITQKWFRDTPVLERLPEESFYRLLAFEYLPERVERCLYLDPDIIIRKSLWPLYSMDLGDAYIAGASHLYGIVNAFNKLRLGVIHKERYINSGVLLMNMTLLRQDFTVKDILQSTEENIQSLWMGDQDLVNILFENRVKTFDERIYNLDERAFHHNRKTFTLEDVKEQTAIIHYNGKYKPWLEGYKGELNCFYPEIKEKGYAPGGRIKAQMEAIHRIICPTMHQKLVLAGVMLFLLLCCICYAIWGETIVKVIADPIAFRQWLRQFGVYDEVIFVAIRAIQTVIKIIPAEPLEIASGYAWGVWGGTFYCLLGNFLGTLVILTLTRKYGVKVLEYFLPMNYKRLFSVLENRKSVYWILFFLYLIPGLPKDGFTYVVGLLPIKTVPFLVISMVARIPSVMTSTVCGETLADRQYVPAVTILVITLLLALLGSALYYKELKTEMQRSRVI